MMSRLARSALCNPALGNKKADCLGRLGDTKFPFAAAVALTAAHRRGALKAF